MTRPARVVGEVPPGYSGPIFYYIRPSLHLREGKGSGRYISLENKDAQRRLAHSDRVLVAHRKDPRLFDEEGRLLDIFDAPLKGRLLKGAPKDLPEWLAEPLALVSERVRNAIEHLQPGKHLFIPIELDTNDGTRRLYAFRVQRDHIRSVFAKPEDFSAMERRFGYLNREVVEGVAVDWDARAGWIISKELMDEIGDVFPKYIDLIPLGVAY